jgi:hypothetical protein
MGINLVLNITGGVNLHGPSNKGIFLVYHDETNPSIYSNS